MPRTSVSISDDLRARMDAVQEPVNWSQVAATAFEGKLAEIAQRKAKKTMSDVIQRLRASRLESESQEYTVGREAGERWAEVDAEWADIERLVNAYDEWTRNGIDPLRDFFRGNNGHDENSGASVVLEMIIPRDELREMSRDDQETAMGRLFGTSDRAEVSVDLAQGFVDGVVAFHKKVKGEVEK